MNRFWTNIILPIIQSINAKYIVEIGSDKGLNTKNILEYCKSTDAHMTAIDPFPNFDLDNFKKEYGEKFEIYEELSISRLPLLSDYDVILIDGDHNWYTVYNELKIIEKTFKNKKFPLIFFHDVGWPYAKRDLYYNPDNIPPVYRHSYKKLGMYPGNSNLEKKGGLNASYNNSIYENSPKNGVLTAIEDFIEESNLEFAIHFINAFYGLGILYLKNKEMERIVTKHLKNADFVSILEEERVKLAINNSKSVSKIKGLEKQLIENKNNLDTTQTLLERRNSEIETMSKKLLRSQKALKNLKLKMSKNMSSFYEMQYFNNINRSITQRLISKFPSLYIMLNKKNYNLRSAIINIKGYKTIKKNKLFDIGYYLKNNKDVRQTGMDPLLHYLYHGFKEGRNPNKTFNGEYYLRRYGDVKKSNLNPLIHYSLYGKKENRKINKQ